MDVASVAVIRDGKMLWLKRRDSGLWTLPGGKFDSEGEEPLDAAARELGEEAGLDAKNELQFLGDDLAHPSADLRVWAFFTEAPEDFNPTAEYDPDQEASEFKWLDSDEFPDPSDVHVPYENNVTLRLMGYEAPEPLKRSEETLEKATKFWVAKDGLKIPHQSEPARAEWDKAYHNKLVEFFGYGDKTRLKPIKIPVTDTGLSGHFAQGAIGAGGRDRRSFYSRMAAAGERLPPIVVRRNGLGWHVVDGNCRLTAAHKHGLKEMDAFELVDPPAPKPNKKVKKSEPLRKDFEDLLNHASASLSDDLRKPKYRGNPNKFAGHCYVSAEALFHMLGGHGSGWVPQNIQHEGDQHWYLKHRETGQILDPTASQFKTKVPYEKGRGRGFLTSEPSKRASELIARIKSRQGAVKSEGLSKGLLGALAGAAIAAAPAPNIHDAFNRGATNPNMVQMIQEQGTKAMRWDPTGLDVHMLPIAHLESSFGQNMAHAKSPNGEFDTAVGALGFKPMTAHEEFKRSPELQQKYGDLTDPTDFLNKFKTDHEFYNRVASSHFRRLITQHGSPEKAAYAWRFGTTAAAKAAPEKINAEPYVIKYAQLKGQKAPVSKAETPHAVLDNTIAGPATTSATPQGSASPISASAPERHVHHPEGTCQCCFKTFKVSRHGGRTISLHGFSRHGDGHQLGACRGQDKPPYEVSCDETKAFYKDVTDKLAEEQKKLEELKSKGEVTTTQEGLQQGWKVEALKQQQLELLTRIKDWKPQHLAMAKSEPLAKMAVSNIKPGEPIAPKLNDESTLPPPTRFPGEGANHPIFDYSHVIKSPLIRKQYLLRVRHNKEHSMLYAEVYNRATKKRVGRVEAGLVGRAIAPEVTNLDSELRGKGLGKSMYEALFAHAYHNHNVRKVRGDSHSSMAHHVHQSLSEKHGFEGYSPDKIGQEKGPFDDAYGDYEYLIRSEEEELAKMAIADNKPGRTIPPSTPSVGTVKPSSYAHMADFSHLIKSPLLKNKYKIWVGHSKPNQNLHGMPINGTSVEAHLLYADPLRGWLPVGSVEGTVRPNKEASVEFASLTSSNHQGKGLGHALYNAFYAHSFHSLGARKATGDVHSSMAGRVHQKIVAEHGLNGYNPKPRRTNDRKSPGPFDDALGPYEYELE
jgi:8-oxo-dGTP pyrophosphatase MutT (NUDIX family)